MAQPHQGEAELVRFHVEDPEDTHTTVPAGSNVVAQDAHQSGGVYAPVVPEGASRQGLVQGDKTAVVTGASGPAPALGRYHREYLVSMKEAPFLALLTVLSSVVLLGWFINTIILVSTRDQTTFDGSRDTTGWIQVLTGPLTTLSTDFYYSYGHELIDIVLSLSTCWAAVIMSTRQIRACAVFATTWVVFSWLIYTKYIFQGLDKGWTYCQSQPNAEENGFAYDYKFCRLSMSNGAWSIMIEVVKVLAMLWAIAMFVKTKGTEPYCELDRNDLEAINRQNARTVDEQRVRQLSNKESLDTVSTVPLGLAAATAPTHVRITSLADCRLDAPGKLVLALCVLSTIGFIVSMLGNIEVQQLGNDSATQPAFAGGANIITVGGPYGPAYASNDGIVGGPAYSTLKNGYVHGLPVETKTGDLNYATNEVFTALLLFFAIGLSVAAAYDRVRDTSINPLMLTFFSSMACFGYFIYAARRVHSSANQQSIHPAFGSQVAIAVGIGITACCEVLRFFALLWKRSRCPAAQTVAPLTARKIFSVLYIVLNVLMFITLIAYFIVLLAIQSEQGLFEYTPATQGTESFNAVYTPIAVQGAIAKLAAAGATTTNSQAYAVYLTWATTAAKAAPNFGGNMVQAFQYALTVLPAPYIAAIKTQLLPVAIASTYATLHGNAADIASVADPTSPTYTANVGRLYTEANSTPFLVANNPRQTYLLGQQTAEDVLVFPYQVFVISLLIAGWVIGMNFYARLRDDRVGNLASMATIAVQCAGWWLMCWPVAYSFAFEEGQAHKIFCRRNEYDSGDYIFTKNVCQEGEATGRLAIIFWIILMLNLFVSIIRWLTSPRDLPLMEVRIAAAQEVRRQEMGLTARDPNHANVLMVTDEKPRHSAVIGCLLFLSIGGWVLWAAASTRQAQRSFWMPVEDQLYQSISFDLYYFIAVHYITLSTLITVFIHAHLALHPTLRHFHYFWRLAEFLCTMMNIFLCVPVLVFMARQINDTVTSEDQTAEFAGIVVLVGAEFLQLCYCQSLFRRYPLFTTPVEFAHFSKRHTYGHHTHHEPITTQTTQVPKHVA